MSTMARITTSIIATLALLVFAASHAVVSSDSSPSSTLQRPERLVSISISLLPENRTHLDLALGQIADPLHPRYGKHLTRDEVKHLTRPSLEAIETLTAWLEHAGAAFDDPKEGEILHWVHAEVPASIAKDLMSLQHRTSQAFDTDMVPEKIKQYLSIVKLARPVRETVVPETIKPYLSPAMSKRSPANAMPPDHHLILHRRTTEGNFGHETVDLDQCKDQIIPACVRKLYRMDDPSSAPEPDRKSLLGIVGFGGQAAQFDQLEEFIQRFDPSSASANFTVELVNGGENIQSDDVPSGEANVDIQYAVSLARNVPVRYYAVGGNYQDFTPDLDLPDRETGSVEPYLEFASYLLDLPDEDLPSVISISYGINEQILGPTYARHVCDIFAQLTARGVSIIAAAGNTGPGASCVANDGTESPKYLPIFPATCPYVTSVGATYLQGGNGSEAAMNFSSGGFSEVFERPAWQEAVVGEWLERHGDETPRLFDGEGRAYPDVAALGANYLLWNHDKLEYGFGTSIAAPVFASMVALLNDESFRQGKPALGWLNPLIWSLHDQGFTDVTQGRSVGCAGMSYAGLPTPEVPNAGFYTAEGWDPVTGWGTPRFDDLKRLLSGPGHGSSCTLLG